MGLRAWWKRIAGGSADAGDAEGVEDAVERVVQVANPRLRLVRRYRARLAPAVAVSLAHVRSQIAAIPAAREASAASWAADPYMHAFFATAGDLARAFGRAPELRAHFERNPDTREACAILSMAMTERRILGMGLDGTTVRSDVAQTSVSFGDYRIRLCGRTEMELKAEIERRLLEQLALAGLARAAEDQARRTELEQERALLKTRLRLLERQGVGMRATVGVEEGAGPAEQAHLASQLDENARELEGLGGGAQLLDSELERLRQVLAEPAQHLYVTTKALRLNRMNIVAENAMQDGVPFEFHVARIPGDPPQDRAFALVRFARADLLPADQVVEEAARLLM